LVKANLESNVLQKTKRYVKNRKSPHVLYCIVLYCILLYCIVLHCIAVLLPIIFSNLTLSFLNFQSPVTRPAQAYAPQQVLHQAPFHQAAVHALRPTQAGALPPAASPALVPTLL
jgi:hypothetical protein